MTISLLISERDELRARVNFLSDALVNRGSEDHSALLRAVRLDSPSVVDPRAVQSHLSAVEQTQQVGKSWPSIRAALEKKHQLPEDEVKKRWEAKIAEMESRADLTGQRLAEGQDERLIQKELDAS